VWVEGACGSKARVGRKRMWLLGRRRPASEQRGTSPELCTADHGDVGSGEEVGDLVPCEVMRSAFDLPGTHRLGPLERLDAGCLADAERDGVVRGLGCSPMTSARVFVDQCVESQARRSTSSAIAPRCRRHRWACGAPGRGSPRGQASPAAPRTQAVSGSRQQPRHGTVTSGATACVPTVSRARPAGEGIRWPGLGLVAHAGRISVAPRPSWTREAAPPGHSPGLGSRV